MESTRSLPKVAARSSAVASSSPPAERWTVLARLPDVAPPSAVPARSGRTSPGDDAVDYRFDPPQPPFQRAGRGERHRRGAAQPSPVLPSSNPFAIPGSNLNDKLGPTARFLMFVALFTLAGIVILSSGREQPTANNDAPPQSAMVSQSLEPATTSMAANISKPTAAVPVQPPDESLDGHAQTAATSDAALPLESRTRDNKFPTDVLDDATESVYPKTNYPSVPISNGAGSHRMPQVQTDDRPPAVAHLPGYITEPPPRHASHDDHESSIY